MALWDGRFSTGPHRALTEFTESISFDQRLYKHDIAGSKAHAQMLGASGIIPQADAAKIIAGLDAIERQIDKGDFEFKAELEDIHMHIESALTAQIGEEGARLHTARSRNDQIALDIRLYLRDQIDLIASGLRDFQRALVHQAGLNATHILPGYTHLQRAQPVLFAHHLLAYVEMFDRDLGRLADCRKRLNVMPLGSGAIAGTTLPIDRALTAKLLDFPEITRNSMDAVADRDFACELLAALALFGTHVSRLSEDIVLWCSAEFAYVELADEFCTGSSLMPQKKNPDVAELSRGKAARVIGDLMALLTLVKGLPLTYNRDMQEDKEPIFDAVDTVRKILAVYPPMVQTMKARPENMLKAARDPALMATDLAEKLVALGVPFRTAHHRVGALVKWCKQTGKPLNGLTIEEMLSVIPEATPECLDLFSPEKSVTAREIPGATGFNEVRKQLDFWEKTLAAN